MTKLEALTKIATLLWVEVGRKTMRVGPIDQAIEIATLEDFSGDSGSTRGSS